MLYQEIRSKVSQVHIGGKKRQIYHTVKKATNFYSFYKTLFCISHTDDLPEDRNRFAH